MTNSAFTRLLARQHKLMSQATALLTEVQDECQNRYGVVYNDHDIDQIIDIHDCGQGEPLTAQTFDEAMKEEGFSRIDKQAQK